MPRPNPLSPRPRLATMAAMRAPDPAAPFALLDGMAHAMVLDAGWQNLADRLTLWLEEMRR